MKNNRKARAELGGNRDAGKESTTKQQCVPASIITTPDEKDKPEPGTFPRWNAFLREVLGGDKSNGNDNK